MSTATKKRETSPKPLVPGDVINFLETVSIQRDDLLFSEPIITRRGMELVVTQQLLDLYGYPGKPSFLTRLDEPNSSGKVIARRGAWPADELTTVPGTHEHQVARDAALSAVWDEFGQGHSAAKANALREVDKTYGRQTDSWTAVNDAWAAHQ